MSLFQRGSYTRLLGAILLMLMVMPLVGHHLGHPRGLSLAFFLLVLVAALDVTQAERRTRFKVWTLGILAIVTSGLSFAIRDGHPSEDHPGVHTVLDVINHGSSVVFFAIVIWLLVMRALAPGRITGGRIVAAICAYLMLGLMWAEAYQALGALYGPVLNTAAETTFQEYVYFSFVTLTTLGYGDILPVHEGARALAYLEAVTGVLYLATLVARLVALHIAHEGLDLIVGDAVDDAFEEQAERQSDEDDEGETGTS